MLPLSANSPTLYHAAGALGARFVVAALVVALTALGGLASGCTSGVSGPAPRPRPPGPPAVAASASASLSQPSLEASSPASVAPAPPPLALASTSPPPTGPAPSYREALGPSRLAPGEPAMIAANLSPSACRRRLAELAPAVTADRRGYAHVAFPVRITGPLHGVRIRTAPAPSKYGVLDCRLALAFDTMAAVLAQHDVAEVRIGTTYRPGARIRGRRKRSQHAYALAADVVALVRSDGRVVPVEGSWGAAIGQTPCGPQAVMTGSSDEAVFMRNAICALARQGVFHHILTPSADAPHQNHIHLDIQRDAKGRWIR